MFSINVIIGGLAIALAVVFLFKFARGVVTTAFAVTIVFIGLFLVVGVPELEQAGRDVGGLIPWTGSAAYTGDAICITSLDSENARLVININNCGTKELKSFEVFINGARIDSEINVDKLLPSTDGTMFVEYSPLHEDIILVKSGVAQDEIIYNSANMSLGLN